MKNSVIEFYNWGILKMEVYTGNWGARGKNKREKLIHRIKQCRKKIDRNVVIKMFDNLKAKVHTANQFGLRSLDK